MATGTRLVYDVKTKKTKTETFEFTPENPRKFEIIERLEKIVGLLQQTDYKAIKYAEGQYTDEQYEPIKQERQALRVEYNALEKELQTLDR